MTLPANDAFSLGLAHDSSSSPSLSRRTSHPRLTRSPSPKIAFSPSSSVSAVKPDISTNMPARRTRRGSGSSIGSAAPQTKAKVATGNGRANGHAPAGENIEEEDERDVDDLLNDKALGKPSPPASPHKIDWEVPRKVFHASIGFAVLPLYTYHITPRAVVVVLSTALVTAVGPADILRFRNPAFARIYERYLGFLMRDSEKTKVNGVIWYLIGAIFSLSAYPGDIAVVSILILSWADTAASTFGRLWGRYTPPLPTHLSLPFLPFVRIPTLFARRKSLAGFIAASITGALITFGFFGWVAPLGTAVPSWTWGAGVAQPRSGEFLEGMASVVKETVGIGAGISTGGWLGLAVISVMAGLVTGVAEALNLGELDDNLTLPIISGGCIFGLFKLLQLISS